MQLFSFLFSLADMIVSFWESRIIVCAKQIVYVAVNKLSMYSTVLWDTEMPVYILYGDGL